MMSSTQLTVGGFTQPRVARGLIEMPANAEKGILTSIPLVFPEFTVCRLFKPRKVDRDFFQKISKYTIRCSTAGDNCLKALNLCSSKAASKRM